MAIFIRAIIINCNRWRVCQIAAQVSATPFSPPALDIIRNDDEEEKAPATVHHSRIAEVFRSKREQHTFLCGECDIYLPDYENCSG